MAAVDVHSRAGLDRYRARVRGCLIGGAVGDALGWPIEAMSWDRIQAAHGRDGLTGLVLGPDGLAEVTDDTQMTLFTVEGLIRTSVRADRGVCHPPSVIHRAHLRWLDTQQLPGPPERPDGWLASLPWLYARRAPGNACVSGLRQGWMGTPARPQNPNSKGCGAVMRSAPFGLLPGAEAEQAFHLAAECATQTHGHPSGYLAAGAFAAIVRYLLEDKDLPEAVDGALDLLTRREGHQEVSAALHKAIGKPRGRPTTQDIEELGGGWVAEEALAIGVFCALAYPGPAEMRDALRLAVNHSGDSDSTGSICGNLLGARHGEMALPADWVADLEGRDTIVELADDLVTEFAQGGELRRDRTRFDRWHERYPGA